MATSSSTSIPVHEWELDTDRVTPKHIWDDLQDNEEGNAGWGPEHSEDEDDPEDAQSVAASEFLTSLQELYMVSKISAGNYCFMFLTQPEEA